MHKKRWFIGFIGLSALILTVFCLNKVQGQNDAVRRGKYLVDTIGACGQCHTPRKGADPDMSMYLAGHPANAPYPKYDFRTMMGQEIFMVTAPTMTAFAAPFGTTFATNLTPDKENGAWGVDGEDVHRRHEDRFPSGSGEQSKSLPSNAREILFGDE